MKKPVSKSQAICISLLWLILCYFVITKAEQVNGMTITMLLMSGALVFIPIYNSFKRR